MSVDEWRFEWRAEDLAPYGDGQEGHGVCVLKGAQFDRRSVFVAFIEEFGWLRGDRTVLIRYHPGRVPGGEKAWALFRDEIEAPIRRGSIPERLSFPDYWIIGNC